MATPETVLDPPRFQKLLDDEFFRPLVQEVRDGVPRLRMLVGDKWRDGDDLHDVVSPIDAKTTIARVPYADQGVVDAAVTAAFDARRAIRNLPGHRRLDVFDAASRLLRDHQGTFMEVLMLEAGKPHHDQKGETDAAADRFKATHGEAAHIYGEYLPGDWSADTDGKIAMVIREPLGVIACVNPFNYPLFIPTAKITPALLAGNTVVAKGSHQTPVSILLLAHLLRESGFPAGTINAINGSGSVAGQALVEDERVRLVSFTGSTTVGKKIYAEGGLKKYHLELGGKGFSLVYDDADVPDAAAKNVAGACKNAGQRCDAVSASVVVQSVLESFQEEAVKAVGSWKVGDPREESTKVGPLISEAAARRVEDVVKDAVAKGAKVVAGGGRNGTYFEPTVLTGVTQDMRAANEEIFGPVLPVLAAKDAEEALEVATHTPYGLDSSVFTRDFQRMWRTAKRLNCGEVTINDLPKHGIGYFPFGGQRESGLGREGIGYSVDLMTELKTIVFTLGPRPKS
jgi:glyceraldehyde-3-phosphate dehydrogenase [NAD(P)+]